MAPAGMVLSEPVVVRVVDADGGGVPAVGVGFRVLAGGGALGFRVPLSLIEDDAVLDLFAPVKHPDLLLSDWAPDDRGMTVSP